MKIHMYLMLKYWRKHKKNAAALLFAGVLLTAVVFVTLMLFREDWVRSCHTHFDAFGHFDLMIGGSNDELLSEILNGEKGYRDDYNYGVINVYGKIGTAGKQFTYGAINDEHDILHVPLEEGRMPEMDTEIAATIQALNEFYWVGKCGDTITLDEKTYTVVGIIDQVYDDNREGTDEELYKHYLGEDSIYITSYRIPSIFVGSCDKEPVYRIDMFSNFWRYPYSDDNGSKYQEYDNYLHEIIYRESRWYFINNEEIAAEALNNEGRGSFFLIIAWIGAVVAVLSVWSILKSVFAQRRNRIETLKNIGMSKRSVGCMYAFECTAFTFVQTLIGLALGLGVYGGIFLFKTSVLLEKPYSGFTDIRRAIEQSHDPFLFACLISVVVMVAAYIINIRTSDIKQKSPKNNAKPHSLSRYFGMAFRQTGVAIVQTVALTLICFSVIMGYVYNTDNGKKFTNGTYYMPPVTSYYANGIEMTKNHIEEYYSCAFPVINMLGHMDNDDYSAFPFASTDYTAGIDDTVVGQLPEYALVTGNLNQTFIASSEPNSSYDNEIDLSNEVVKNRLLTLSSEEYQDFFEKGNLGSKSMYRVDTKITPARNIETLSETVVEGEINIDALSSGEEILVTYTGIKPPFKTGETITVYSAGATETGYGIGSIHFAEVKIGAILQISPKIGAAKSYTLRNDQDYNFLTTARGADVMGLHNARYTEIFSSEPMNGNVIPSSAEMTMQSLDKMKWETVKNKIISISGMLMILLLMSLMGFAVYFNGIGMKIRAKSYEISVIRAVGTSMSALRKHILINSIKIPIISFALSYGMVKLAQYAMEKVYRYRLDCLNRFFETGEEINTPIGDFFVDHAFLNKVMWQVKPEIPSLILLAVLCAVTFILTAIALKKFKRNIAGGLNEGRTKQ